jgi:hypothetical protein
MISRNIILASIAVAACAVIGTAAWVHHTGQTNEQTGVGPMATALTDNRVANGYQANGYPANGYAQNPPAAAYSANGYPAQNGYAPNGYAANGDYAGTANAPAGGYATDGYYPSNERPIYVRQGAVVQDVAPQPLYEGRPRYEEREVYTEGRRHHGRSKEHSAEIVAGSAAAGAAIGAIAGGGKGAAIGAIAGGGGGFAYDRLSHNH